MQIVTREGAAREGTRPVDEAKLAALEGEDRRHLRAQADAFYTSGLLLDDGVIDPRDTRRVLAFASPSATRRREAPCRPMQFGVARP